jgi:hypothetical protein
MSNLSRSAVDTTTRRSRKRAASFSDGNPTDTEYRRPTKFKVEEDETYATHLCSSTSGHSITSKNAFILQPLELQDMAQQPIPTTWEEHIRAMHTGWELFMNIYLSHHTQTVYLSHQVPFNNQRFTRQERRITALENENETLKTQTHNLVQTVADIQKRLCELERPLSAPANIAEWKKELEHSKQAHREDMDKWRVELQRLEKIVSAQEDSKAFAQAFRLMGEPDQDSSDVAVLGAHRRRSVQRNGHTIFSRIGASPSIKQARGANTTHNSTFPGPVSPPLPLKTTGTGGGTNNTSTQRGPNSEFRRTNSKNHVQVRDLQRAPKSTFSPASQPKSDSGSSPYSKGVGTSQRVVLDHQESGVGNTKKHLGRSTAQQTLLASLTDLFPRETAP